MSVMISFQMETVHSPLWQECEAPKTEVRKAFRCQVRQKKGSGLRFCLKMQMLSCYFPEDEGLHGATATGYLNCPIKSIKSECLNPVSKRVHKKHEQVIFKV